MLKIGEFSKLCRTTIKTLHHYDELGLLKPSYVDEQNGYRYYKPEQLHLVSEIKSLKEINFSLEEILHLFSSKPNPQERLLQLKYKRLNIIQTIQHEEKRLKNIDSLIYQTKKEVTMNQVQMKSLPEVIVASMKLTIPNYDHLFTVVPPMGEKMKSHGAVCRDPFYCFNIYHDEEYKSENIDIEVCEAVEKQLENKDGIIYKTIPGIKQAACIYHKGSYSTLGSSYAVLMKWIEDNDQNIIQQTRESYIDGCWNKENPEDWLTEIQIPLN